MPLNGEQVDRLLSGYLDGCLDEAESTQVELVLQEPAVQTRLRELEVLRGDLRILRDLRRNAAPGLAPDFSGRVWDAIQQQRTETQHQTQGTPTGTLGSDGTRVRWAMALIATAAALVLFAYWPGRSVNNGSSGNGLAITTSTDMGADGTEGDGTEADGTEGGGGLVPLEPVPGESLLADVPIELDSPDVPDLPVATEPAVLLTGKDSAAWNQQLMFTLVIDMQLSLEAMRAGYLSAVFAAHGIALESPVVAELDVLAELAESRMTVQPAEDAGGALLYFVHTDSKASDQVLREFMNDLKNVPWLRVDLAYNAPVNKFMREVVATAADQFPMDESFAAQIGGGGNAGQPLVGIGPQGKLVSDAARRQQVPDYSALGAKSTFLLMVRLPE